MSCFWVGLQAKVPRIAEMAKSPDDVLSLLQRKNQLCTDVTWQGERLSPTALLENFCSVRDYTENGHRTGGGHLTSACDPFLLLVSQVFRCDIDFRFVNTNIQIRYVGADTGTGTGIPIYKFNSSSSHFT
jgi:hypothetical protein